MFLTSLHFHPPLEARGLELHHLPDQIKELLYAVNLLPSAFYVLFPVIEVSKKTKKTQTPLKVMRRLLSIQL